MCTFSWRVPPLKTIQSDYYWPIISRSEESVKISNKMGASQNPEVKGLVGTEIGQTMEHRTGLPQIKKH